MGIQEFSIIAKPKKPLAKRLFFTLLLIAAALTVVYTNLEHYQGVVGLSALAVITAAVLIFTRYVVCEYTYAVMISSDGEPLFIVTSRTGKRISTLCRLSLGDIVKIEKEDRKTRRSHKTPNGYLKYNYLPTLGADSSYRITAYSRYEKAEVNIEPEDDIADLLLRYAKIAAENRRIADEDEPY